MAVKWKPSATALCVLCCFLIILSNAFVNGVRVQSKRVKAATAKGKCVWHSSKITTRSHFALKKPFLHPNRAETIRWSWSSIRWRKWSLVLRTLCRKWNRNIFQLISNRLNADRWISFQLENSIFSTQFSKNRNVEKWWNSIWSAINERRVYLILKWKHVDWMKKKTTEKKTRKIEMPQNEKQNEEWTNERRSNKFRRIQLILVISKT